MGLRELGYRPYEGKRLPPREAMGPLLRHGLRRAWAHWLVKMTLVMGWVPVVMAGVFDVVRLFAQSTVATQMAGAEPVYPHHDDFVFALLRWQAWLFASMVALGAGAGAVSGDLGNGALVFYLSRPVTREQYLLSRVGAVGLWIFLLLFVPGLLMVLLATGLAPREMWGTELALLVPTVAFSLLVAVVFSTVSVGISALSASRATTMTTWLLVFLVPEVFGGIVEVATGAPWVRLASLSTLLVAVGRSLFRLEAPAEGVQWFHALPILVAASMLSLWASWRRLGRVEVLS